MGTLEEKLQKIIAQMEKELDWDEMQAAEMDERGLIHEMDIYDKAVEVRRSDITLLKSILTASR